MTDPSHLIAFAGVPGANADLACREAEPYMETLPCGSFEEVFEAVADGRAAKGMIPVENSQAGRVAEIHNLLPKTELLIVGEHFQPVQHCLAAPKGAGKAGIKHVYSHPQALMQCRDHLKKLGAEAHMHSNTAVAAKDVAEWNDPAKAAICSPLAAELYGLTVLERHFEDSDQNTTVFIVIGREPARLADNAMVLTSLLFSLRNLPAALYKSLGGFATNGINIVKLESYITGGQKSAQFFITFEGRMERVEVQRALEELDFYTDSVKNLGSYPASLARLSEKL